MTYRAIPDLNPEEVVVQLELKKSLQIEPQTRPSGKFLVAGDKLFLGNYYGPIEVYNLSTERKVSTMHFNSGAIKEMANDGRFIYLHQRGEFEFDGDNYILARVDQESGDVKIYDKPLKSFNDLPLRGKSGDSTGIHGRIISIPLSTFISDSIVWNPSLLAKEGPCFLFPSLSDMDIRLYSNKDNHASISIPNNMQHDLGNQTVYLKDGKVSSYDGSKVDNVRPIDEIHVSGSRLSGIRGLEARMLHWNEKMTDGPNYVPVSLLFKGCNISNRLTEVCDVQRSGNLIYVLHNPFLSDRSNKNGVTGVTQPATMYTYEMSLQNLKPIEANA